MSEIFKVCVPLRVGRAICVFVVGSMIGELRARDGEAAVGCVCWLAGGCVRARGPQPSQGWRM